MIDLSKNHNVKSICKRIKKEDIEAINYYIINQGKNIDWNNIESMCASLIHNVCKHFYYEQFIRFTLQEKKDMRSNLLLYFKEKYK
jgi:hypothetical protein